MRKTIVSAMWITCAFLLASCGGGSGDLLGPGGGVVQVALVEPASTTAAPTSTRVVVRFDTPMSGPSITDNTFRLLLNSVPVPVDNVSYNAATLQATLIPKAVNAGLPALNPGSTYTVQLTTGVRTEDGISLALPQTIDFRTEAAPAVTVVAPANGAGAVPVASVVRVTFSKPVVGVNDNTFFLEANGSRVPCSAPAPDATTTIFSLTPNSPLIHTTTFTVTVTNGVKDGSGNPLASTSSTTFRTVSLAVPPAPTVRVPDNNATDVSVTAAVTVAFNQPITIGRGNFSLTRVSTNPPEPVQDCTVTATAQTVTFTPDFQLSPQSVYEAVLLAGSSGLQDNLVWTFTTAAAGQRIDQRGVAAGGSHALAVWQDGSLWSWGGNAYGQLGDGTTASRNFARRIDLQRFGGATATKVAAGETHSLALLDNGSVIAWGGNAFGQLGDNTVTNSPVPVLVSDLGDVVHISSLKSHNLALKSDGTVWAWGANAFGQIGDNTATAARLTPVQVLTGGGPPLTGVVEISAGGEHSLALDGSGQVWQWGRNGLGDVDLDRHAVKVVETAGGSPVDFNLGAPGLVQASIAAGNLHSVAVDTSGTIYTWGSNEFGQLGNGGLGGFVTTPVPVAQAPGIIFAATAGPDQTFAFRITDTNVFGWGRNDKGQLCDGSTNQRNAPQQLVDFAGNPLTLVGDFASGGSGSVFIKSVSKSLACGSNASGQLGTGVGATELPKSALPVQVYFNFNLQP